MATVVIPADQLAVRHRTRFADWPDRRFALALVSGLTLLAFVIHGYHPYAEDGGLYLAGIERLLDPTLFPHSADFVLEPTRFSLFASAVAAVVRLSHLTLPVALLLIHLASIWSTLFAAWMLAARCWPTGAARTGAVTVLACWLSLPIAGTALVLMDPYLTARSISTPSMVLALIGTLDATALGSDARRSRGVLLWLASITCAAAMHPLMAAYAFAATLVLAGLRSHRPNLRRWTAVAFPLLALGAAACTQAVAHPESTAYQSIALTRTYWFPAEWHWYELIGLAAPLAIVAICDWRWSTISDDPPAFTAVRRSLGRMALLAGATAVLVAILFARPTSSIHLIARLQPLRIFQMVYLLMALALGATLGEYVLKRSTGRWIAALLLLGGVMIPADRSAFPNTRPIELPGAVPHNRWMQAFLWIRENTPKDALFALDPDYINAPGEGAQCFRAIAQRSSLPDYSKDGGEASIAPDLAPAWKAGQSAQQKLSANTDAVRLATLTSFGVSWVVLDAHATTAWACPFVNSAVKVCRLPLGPAQARGVN